MKTTRRLAALIAAATLPLTAIPAEETGQTETTDQKQDQSSEAAGMKGHMMSLKDQDAEVDKLVAEMNSASADKKLDAVAAVLTKLVEQRKKMHEHMQKMMSSNEKEAMGMCRMMMGMDTKADHDGGQSHHH